MADISKIKINNNLYNVDDAAAVAYGTCSTAAGTAKKIITLKNAINWHLKTGSIIVVHFTNTNTASNPIFNVNNSGDKHIYYNTSVISTTNLGYAGTANRPMEFMYNGTNWVFIGWSYDANTNTDIMVKQSPSTTSNFRPLLLGYNNSADASQIGTEVTNQSYITTKLYANPSTGTIYTNSSFVSPTSTVQSNQNGVPEGQTAISMLIHNGTNLWIGAAATKTSHHIGGTSISTGYDDINKKGNETINIVVPNEDNTNGTRYLAIHTGNYDSYVKRKQRIVAGHNSTYTTGDNAWFKIASCKLPTTTYIDKEIIFLVSTGYGRSGATGILSAHIRQGSTVGTLDNVSLVWTASNLRINLDDFVIAYSEGDTTGVTAELWVRSTASYLLWHFDVLQQLHRTAWDINEWTLYNEPAPQASITKDYTQVTSEIRQLDETINTYLPLAGGTMTGPIKYNSGSRTSQLFTVLDGDANGSCLSIGGTGGLTIIGGGESATNLANLAASEDKLTLNTGIAYDTMSEQMIVSSDNHIFFSTNCQDVTNKKTAILSSDLALYPDITNTGSIGTTKYKWANIYATTFNGNLVGNASSATKWNTARNINGMQIDGQANSFNYGKCTTAAATAAKTVACGGFLSPVEGSEITVKFTATNTASNPTLNVNNTGAKPIYYRGAAITAGYLAANRTYTFRYNGTQYELVGDINTNNAVSVSKFNLNGTTNAGTIRPLLFANSNANPNNETETIDKSPANSSKCTAYSGGVSMTGGLYLKTNYWTTAQDAPVGTAYVELCVPDGIVRANSFDGNLAGNAQTASKLKFSRTINGIPFDGTQDISLIDLLYSGTGSFNVTLTSSSTNYNAFIVDTSLGTFLKLGTGYSCHTYTTYPYPSQGGINTVECGNLNLYISGTTCSGIIAKYQIKGTSSGVFSENINTAISIKSVYGIKFS